MCAFCRPVPAPGCCRIGEVSAAILEIGRRERGGRGRCRCRNDGRRCSAPCPLITATVAATLLPALQRLAPLGAILPRFWPVPLASSRDVAVLDRQPAVHEGSPRPRRGLRTICKGNLAVVELMVIFSPPPAHMSLRCRRGDDRQASPLEHARSTCRSRHLMPPAVNAMDDLLRLCVQAVRRRFPIEFRHGSFYRRSF